MSSEKAFVDEVVRETLQPDLWAGGLPNDQGYGLARKNVTAYASMPTTGIAAYSGSAGIVWRPKRGYNDIDFGYFPNAVTLVNAVCPGFPAFSMTAQLTPSCFIPATVNNSRTISVEPNIASTLSMTRNVAALLECYSASIGTTMAALNGTIGCAAIADFRDLATFTQADLAQHAVTNSSACIGVPAGVGVATVLGPDINIDLQPADYQFVASHRKSGTLTVDIVGSGTNVSFITPYNVTPPVGVLVVPCDPIPYWVNTRTTFRMFAAAGAPSSAVVAPVYISIDNGSLTPNVLGVVESWHPYPYGGQNLVFSDEWVTPPGFMLLGFLVVGHDSLGGNVTNATFTIEALDLYEPENIGCVRVVRFDDLGPNQQLVVKYSGMVEGLPTGAIAPYVKASDESDQLTANVVLQGLRRVYSLNIGGLSRCMSRSVYAKLVGNKVPEAEIIQSIRTGHAASGPLSTLASAFGSIGGSLFGNPNIGRTLGGALGSIGDHILGFANSRKRLRSRNGDYFGQSASMMGAAASMMGDTINDAEPFVVA